MDDYVYFAIGEQNRKRERIIHALSLPIPSEYIRRSKSALYKPLLRAAVAERLREEAEKQDISADRVIKEISLLALSDMSDYIESIGFGDFRVKPLQDIPPEKTGAIKSIETKPTMYGLATKITLHDKTTSLKHIAELMGLIASDKAPPLLDYAKPPVTIDNSNKDDEKLYMDLING